VSNTTGNDETAHRGVKALFAAVGLLGTMASVWWFALRPRRKRSGEQRREQAAGEAGGA